MKREKRGEKAEKKCDTTFFFPSKAFLVKLETKTVKNKQCYLSSWDKQKSESLNTIWSRSVFNIYPSSYGLKENLALILCPIFWYQKSGVEKWFILTLSSQCDQNCNHGRSSSMRPEKQYELTEDDTTTFFDNGSFFLATCLVFSSRWKSQHRGH